MTVAVVDVGSNTVRLLLAAQGRGGPVAVGGDKRAVGLGADVERHGAVSAEKLAEAAEAVRGFAETAHAAGAMLFDVVVASPGRQARNADQLVHVLSRAAGVPARVLTREEEGALAFDGAVAFAEPTGVVAVCDVGGGSTQIAVGTVERGAAWVRSVDLGALRLSARVPDDYAPLLREEARAAFAGLIPPRPHSVLAVGGTARAIKKLVGRTLGPAELEAAAAILARQPIESVIGPLGIQPWRARLLPAGVAILAQVQQVLGRPLQVGRGGLREGLALQLLDRLRAARVS